MRIFPIFCVITMILSLSACSLERVHSPYALYLKVSDNFSGDVVGEVLGKRLDGSASEMSRENSQKLTEAIHDIRINNSRIALPVMLCDLPEGFSAEPVSEVPLESHDFSFFEGDLLYNGEKLAIVYIIREKRAEESQSVIVGALLSSSDCKWSVGEADVCGSSLRDIFGEPSSSEPLASESVPDYAYIADNGDFALFISSVNSTMLFSLDCAQLENNKSLCAYAPYDDFNGFSELAPVSGEPREFDINAAFAENGIVIGDFSCPANIKISEIGGDIGLAYYETEPYDESDEAAEGYVSDTYLLLYKGRYFGIVQSFRKEGQPMDEGQMYVWTIYGREDIFCDASLAGIPVSQDIESIGAIFENSSRNEDGDVSMYGISKADGEQYFVIYIRDFEGRSTLMLMPYFK